MWARIRRRNQAVRDRGASAVEYGLMVAAIAAVIVAIVFGLGNVISHSFSDTCTALAPAQTQFGTQDCETDN